MKKRRNQISDDRAYYSEDDPIGLTSAFTPVKGAQSVDYDTGDDPVGLTQAFGPIVVEEPPYGQDDASKWQGFDWNSSEGKYQYADDTSAFMPVSGDEGSSGGWVRSEPAATQASSEEAGQAAAGAAAAPAAAAKTAGSASVGKHGRHAAPTPELSPRMKQSRRTRIILIVVILLVLVAIGGVGYFMSQAVSQSQEQATHQTQEQAAASRGAMVDEQKDDAAEAAAQLTDVPELTSVIGMSQEDAVAHIGHGATVTSTRSVTEKGSAIKTNAVVALTDEPSDTRTGGTPTVYLGMDKDGNVLQVGYSASASALGFGSLSFTDAVNSEHVVEKTLQKIGVSIDDEVVSLPEDKDKFSTYASDGTTVTKERYSFSGDTYVNDQPCSWSSVLSYDYTTQVLTGNLSDTVRVIYAYVTLDVEPEEEEEAEEEAPAEGEEAPAEEAPAEEAPAEEAPAE